MNMFNDVSFSSFRSGWVCSSDGGGMSGGGSSSPPASSGDGGGATSSPSSSSPTSITPSEISTGGSAAGRDDGNDSAFESFDLSDPGIDGIVLEPGASGAAVGEPAASPGATGGSEGSPGATSPAPVVAPVASPTAQPTTTEAPTTAAEITDSNDVTIDNIAPLLLAEKDVLIDKWAKDLFALSQEESDALATTPEQVLPKLAGRILHAAVSAMSSQIKQFVPKMIDGHLSTTAKYSEAEAQFFSAWPGLRGKDTAVISHAITAVKAAFPKLSRADAIAKAGEMSAVMLGISVDLAKKAGGGATPSPSAGPTSGGNGAARVVAPPFRPAGAGSAHGTSAGNGHAVGGSSDDPFADFDLPFSGQ